MGVEGDGISGASEGPGPSVASDEASGVFRVCDPRVFRAEGRAFCRRWLEASLRRPGVLKAGVDLATATATLEFRPGEASTSEMASTFSAGVHEALAISPKRPTDRLDWVALAGFAGPAPACWEVTRRSSDRLRFRPAALAIDPARRADWLERMVIERGVIGCRLAWFSDEVTVAFDPDLTKEARLLDVAHRAWWESARAFPGTSLVLDPRGRTLNLLKAGGSFAMTLVGIAVPGIPTVPFLLATSFYLARSSPRLNGVLLHAPLFGPVLVEWEAHHGLGLASKAKLLGLSAAIATLTLLLIPMTPLALIPVLLISLASVYATLNLPGLEGRASLEHREAPGFMLALG